MNQQITIDQQVIQSLLNLGGKDLIKELKNVFISSSQNLIQEIQNALNQKDFTSLKNQAHSLKSSSANIGAMKLSSLCLKIENASLEKNWALAQELNQLLIQEFNLVCLELAAITA